MAKGCADAVVEWLDEIEDKLPEDLFLKGQARFLALMAEFTEALTAGIQQTIKEQESKEE